MNNNIMDYHPINPLVIGKIGSSHGISGWIKLFSFTQKPERIFDYQPWFVRKENKWQQIKQVNWKYYKQILLFKVNIINDRNHASRLTNCEIIINSTQLFPLDEGNYYWKDLIGCRVINLNNYDMGKVINLIETGSNDVLVIKTNYKDNFYGHQRLIPFIDKQVIKKVNLSLKIIKVDWQPDF